MTRGKAERQPSNTVRPRINAGVKELNEMMIGRTDDPGNPFVAPAFEAAPAFETGSRTPSGLVVMVRMKQAGHMIAIDPPVRFFTFCSCIRRAVNTCDNVGVRAPSRDGHHMPQAPWKMRSFGPLSTTMAHSVILDFTTR